MTTEEIKQVQAYFSDRLYIFPKDLDNSVLNHLSDSTQEILFSTGFPSYKGYGGKYITLDRLELIDDGYLRFLEREGEKNYSEYINLKNNEIYFKNKLGTLKYMFINCDLESYLKYIEVFEDFRDNVVIPEKLGSYWGDLNFDGYYEKYARELKKRFLAVNDDVKKSEVWGTLIQEMELGVI